MKPKNGSETVWRLVYGKNEHKEGLPDVNIGLYQGHCFYIKNLHLLAKSWECTGCKKRFNQNTFLKLIAKHNLEIDC